MKRGPSSSYGSTDFVARARAAWGPDAPDWIIALATEATRSSGKATAERLGYSSSVISQALSNSYGKGNLARLEQVVRGAFMDQRVDCRELGEIGLDRCLAEQQEPFRATSAHRVRLYHACNTPGRCAHSKATAQAPASSPASGDQS